MYWPYANLNHQIKLGFMQLNMKRFSMSGNTQRNKSKCWTKANNGKARINKLTMPRLQEDLVAALRMPPAACPNISSALTRKPITSLAMTGVINILYSGLRKVRTKARIRLNL